MSAMKMVVLGGMNNIHIVADFSCSWDFKSCKQSLKSSNNVKIPKELKFLLNYLNREEEHLQLSPTESSECITKISSPWSVLDTQN